MKDTQDTQEKTLFTEISAEESATVNGGWNYYSGYRRYNYYRPRRVYYSYRRSYGYGGRNYGYGGCY